MIYVLLVFATFWAWETIRLPAERYVPALFVATRPLHPFIVLALPLYVLWPDWVGAMAATGATGLLVALVERFVAPTQDAMVIQRPTPGARQLGLPTLP